MQRKSKPVSLHKDPNALNATALRFETVQAQAARGQTLQLVLPFDRRKVSRQLVVLSDGREAGLFLPRGTVLRGGDLLISDQGLEVAIKAADEAVMVVTATDFQALSRAAYHLGNRHIPVEVGREQLKLEYDYVLLDLLQRLGVTVQEVMTAFEPEAGAYGGGHRHADD